jgi:hypothetical protein
MSSERNFRVSFVGDVTISDADEDGALAKLKLWFEEMLEAHLDEMAEGPHIGIVEVESLGLVEVSP